MANVPKNKKLKILFLPAWYPSEDIPLNGTFIKEHAKAASLYNDIVVLYVYPDPSFQFKCLYTISEENEDGIRTIRVKYGGMFTYFRRLTIWIRKRNTISQGAFQDETHNLFYKVLRVPLKAIRDFLWCWTIYIAFRKLLKKGWRPDVIHAHVFTAGVPGIMLGRIYKIPVIITEHYTGFPRHILSKLDILKAKFAMNRANIILPVSDDLGKHIQSYGIHNRFQVVPNVVNTEIFYPESNINKRTAKKILLVASLEPKKGISYLLQALGKLKGRRNDFVLDIVGDGLHRSEYEKQARDLDIVNEVKFHGLKPKEKVVEFMRQCDFFVLPSLFETFGVVLIEALASGKPVIATNIGGPNEIVNKDVGILVPPKDVNALAEAIDDMLDHYQEYSSNKISRCAKERFSYKVVGETLTQVYKETVKEF